MLRGSPRPQFPGGGLQVPSVPSKNPTRRQPPSEKGPKRGATKQGRARGWRCEGQGAKIKRGRGSGGRPLSHQRFPKPPPGAQRPQLTKGCLSRSSAVGLRFSSTKICLRKLRQELETPSGSWGLVGCVAILKIAAMASNSAQGGFSVSISTTVQATLLQRDGKTTGESRLVRFVLKWVFFSALL